jgi:phenylpyruvate tautomerase PptA (4-oxalocrotonate tautomerase family)
MPILDIEIVAPDSTQSLPADLTQSLANEAAQVFGAQAGTVWVKMRIIPLTQYAENNRTSGGTYPVFVTVLRSRVPKGSELQNEIARVTQVIANVLNRPETNVHIIYQPDGAELIAFGGKLVE